MKRLLALILTGGFLAAPVGAKGHFYAGCKKSPCKRHVVKPFKPKLLRMASCESNQRWRLDSSYDGGLQFDPGTWRETGSKIPFAYMATMTEQMYRAVIWRFRIGTWVTTAGWPVCGYR